MSYLVRLPPATVHSLLPPPQLLFFLPLPQRRVRKRRRLKWTRDRDAEESAETTALLAGAASRDVVRRAGVVRSALYAVQTLYAFTIMYVPPFSF
jgi:hypothetical protein